MIQCIGKKKKRAAVFGAVLALIAVITGGCRTSQTEEIADVPRIQCDYTLDMLNEALNPYWRSLSVASEPYRIAWFSDTQAYASACPELHLAFTMAQWVVSHQQEQNIQLFVHTGDFVDHPDSETEWASAMEGVDPIRPKLPWMIAGGNHDLNPALGASIAEQYGTYAQYCGENSNPVASEIKWYQGGVASARRVHIGSLDYCVVSVGFAAEEDAMNWAVSQFRLNEDCIGILITHDYLLAEGELSDNGNILFSRIVERAANVRLVLCGHNHGETERITEIDDNGDGQTDRTVIALMTNYQMEAYGGNGYFNLLTVNEREGTLSRYAYSPVTDDWGFAEGDQEVFYTIKDWFTAQEPKLLPEETTAEETSAEETA